jgi:hypothetical protein
MITALQVSGGGLPLLFARRRRRAFRPPQAVASDAAAAAEGTAREDGGKVALGGSGVSVTKLGVGAWSWGDTTYWNEFRWDGAYVSPLSPRALSALLLGSGFLSSWLFPRTRIMYYSLKHPHPTATYKCHEKSALF